MSLDKIDHIVVLMFENRSFDNMLGFLYSPADLPAQNIRRRTRRPSTDWPSAARERTPTPAPSTSPRTRQ